MEASWSSGSGQDRCNGLSNGGDQSRPATTGLNATGSAVASLRRQTAVDGTPTVSIGTTKPYLSRASRTNSLVARKPGLGQIKSNLITPAQLKKAYSTQNLTRGDPSLRRSSSTQNISAEKNCARSSKTSHQAMAYNAELLASFEKEKKLLESRISELTQITEKRKTEIERYKIEIRNLKEQMPDENLLEEVKQLRSLNKQLRQSMNTPRPAGAAERQLSETKLLPSSGDSCSSKSNDLCLNLTETSKAGTSVLETNTPDHPSTIDTSVWERGSVRSGKSDSTSEMSLDYLHHRIMLMEETNYSTTEELQATIQELQDLQRAVDELTDENESLVSKNSRLLEALCDQTLKLENCRSQIEHLKALLLSDHDSQSNRSEHERQLVELLKGAQEEREELLLQQTELHNALRTLEAENSEVQQAATLFRDRCAHLEEKLSELDLERRQNEKVQADLKEMLSGEQIELKRYKNLLENEHSKVVELEQYQKASNKTEVEKLLHTALEEKSKSEKRVTELEQDLAICQKDLNNSKEMVESLRTRLSQLDENRQKEVGEVENRLSKAEEHKQSMEDKVLELSRHISVLEQDCQRYIDEKTSFQSTITKLQAELSTSKKRNVDLEKELEETISRHEAELHEWQQFQHDLQMAVVIANDLSQEAQNNIKEIRDENQELHEKALKLEEELKRTRNELELVKATQASQSSRNENGTTTSTRKSSLGNNGPRGPLDAHQISSALQKGRLGWPRPAGVGSSQQQTLSVKNIIRSIEDQVKNNGSTLSNSSASSRRSSTDSLDRIARLDGRAHRASPVMATAACAGANAAASTSAGAVSAGPATSSAGASSSSSPSSASLAGNSANQLRSALKKPSSSVSTSSTLAGNSGPVVTQNATDNVKAAAGVHSPVKQLTGSVAVTTTTASHDKKDPLAALVKQTGGSKRNALLKWCQNKTHSYRGVDITNFSSSWNDGLAFCALLHSYVPQLVPYEKLTENEKRHNFEMAFRAAEQVGISSMLDIDEMVAVERPDWQLVMSYVISIYRHFEVDGVAK